MRGLAAALFAAAVLLAGCSGEADTVAEQARAGDQLGYISGDGAVQLVPVAERDTTIKLTGTTLEGQPWDSAEHRGSVVVINVWGSWCGPCEAEAPDLAAAHEYFERAGEPVKFIGVNDRDSVPTALAFHDAHEVGYPSLVDDGGATILDLQGLANARPSTLVLDTEGRVAARVLGQVDESTLRGMVQDVLAS